MPDLFSVYEEQTSKEIAPITFDPTVLRTALNDNKEIVYCLSDVLAMVTETKSPKDEMYHVKKNLTKEGVQLSQIVRQYKFMAPNGRRYSMLGGTREQIFRVLQEVNSPRVAPFKSWLAKLGNERLEEIENPDLAVQLSTNYSLISNLTYKDKPIRRAKLKDGTEVWVVIDVIGAITGSKNPTQYWNVAKRRMLAEGGGGSTICLPMFMKDALGREQKTQVMTLPQLLRMLQSLPSKKAEPFRIFMAEAGYTLIKETQNPDLAVQRGYEGYIKKGKSPKWAKARVNSILHRNDLTQKWLDHGVNEPKEFAMLTDRESKGTFGRTTGEMKKEKSLAPTQNLRDNMTEAELLAQDASDMAISLLIDKHNPQGYTENAKEVDTGSTVGAMLMEKFNEILKD